jgi:hypothetical protein
MPADLALDLPQSSQDPAKTPSTPAKKTQTTSNGLKWGGIALMAGGGGLMVRGAVLTDPCKSYGPGYICTSNYQTVRFSSLAIGGVAVAAGALLFAHRHHN